MWVEITEVEITLETKGGQEAARTGLAANRQELLPTKNLSADFANL